jgi:hypothetical protein
MLFALIKTSAGTTATTKIYMNGTKIYNLTGDGGVIRWGDKSTLQLGMLIDVYFFILLLRYFWFLFICIDVPIHFHLDGNIYIYIYIYCIYVCI